MVEIRESENWVKNTTNLDLRFDKLLLLNDFKVTTCGQYGENIILITLKVHIVGTIVQYRLEKN